MTDIISVPAIMVIAYLVGEVVKASGIPNKWIPIIAGIAGGALGALALSVMTDFPANDYITAVAIGIASGLAAVGVNQIVKQFK